MLLVKTATAVGLDRGLATALAPWRKPRAVHDPGKILLDLALAVAVGGDCLADIGQARSVPAVFGQVASDPTVSRLIDALAADTDAALAAIDRARATGRHQAWHLAGADAPDHQISECNPLAVDLDASSVTAHSEKELASPTYKRGFGFHPLLAFADHGAQGTGESLTVMLRTGRAGANTAGDHIKVTADALAQLPSPASGRFGREILIRTDGAGGTHKFVQWLTDQHLAYSVGFGLCEPAAAAVDDLPDTAWIPAIDATGTPRKGAWVAELTQVIPLKDWPKGMRVIVRAERPHPGAQLRFTDSGGHRLTAFATNSASADLPELELRHRRRARCEDRISRRQGHRPAEPPAARFRPKQDLDRRRPTGDGTERMDADAGHGRHRRAAVGTQTTTAPAAAAMDRRKLARRSRQTWLTLSKDAPWAALLTAGLKRLQTRPAPT